MRRRACLLLALMFFCAAAAWPQPRNRVHMPQFTDIKPVEDLTQGSGPIVLADAGVKVTFQREANRLRLLRIRRPGQAPFVQEGSVGNPMAMVILDGKHKGVYGMETFRVNRLFTGPRRLLAFVEHDRMPILISLDITVEGNVINWLGQALWNGEESLEANIYFPLLSRVRFDSPEKDRAIFPQTSGSVRGPLGTVNYSRAYLGSLSSPTFIVEGGGRGLAVLDDNRADFAPDPGAAARRLYVAGNMFPLPEKLAPGGSQGPFIGICHTRVFRAIGEFGGETTYNSAEAQNPPYMKKLGDGVDLGPVRTYAYEGNWKAGALWLRAQRQHVPMKVSPAQWYRSTTFLSESGVEGLARQGKSMLELPKILENRRRGGAEFMHLTGFHDGELLGVNANMQDRGDYFFAAQNLGGFEDARKGIEAGHRAGGHFIYYVEGMIVWKRGRIGRSQGQDWALLNQDGTPTEHYRGFWHACPAHPGYQDWLAKTLAEVVRTTGVDGFFIDSTLATYNHRCFNPAHKHPHPDVWNWGVRQMLRRVREELDKVNPEAILIVEGCGDMGREFADGFVSHSHAWTQETFTEPFVRFLHPDMRAYESWGASGSNAPMGFDKLQKLQVWNSVNGHRIYAHAPSFDKMAPLSLRTRQYYDSFPEICDNQMSPLDAACKNCIAQLFEGANPIVTVGNDTGKEVDAELSIPVRGAILLDRVDGARVQIAGGKAPLKLKPYEFRAFEVRP